VSVHDEHWLRMDDERQIVGCHCGFMANENDCGYGDSVLKHVVTKALDSARWEIHAMRFAKEEGELRGPDNFYNGVITSEAVLRRAADDSTT
jgi:hypothetical protein